jgi:aspartyl protease family protein
MVIWQSLIGAGSVATALFAVGGHTLTEKASPRPVPAAALTSPTRVASAPLMSTRSSDGLFYLVARINGTDVRFVVDTGATTTVFSKRDAQRVGLVRDKSRGSSLVETAAGPMATDWTRVDGIELGGRHLGSFDAILPAGHVRTSLLGQDIISRLDSLAISGDRMVLN